FAPPFEAFGRKGAAEPVAYVLARPILDAVPLEHFDYLRNALGGARPQRRWRADHDQRLDPLGPARREGAGDRAADLGADQMKAVNAKMIHQQAEILDQPIERPGIIAR